MNGPTASRTLAPRDDSRALRPIALSAGARAVGLALALGGCAAAPLGRTPAVGRLCISNPDRLDVSVAAIDGDRRVTIANPGRAETAELSLLAGAYVVHAPTPHGTLALQAPLHAVTHPEGTPRGQPLTVRLEVPPPRARSDAAFAWIPAGPALIGDALGVGQEDERPARVVDVPAFWLGRCELTNAEYAAFLGAVDPDVDPGWCAFDSRKCRLARDAVTGQWTTPAPQQPVVTVSLAGAQAYCDWWTRRTGVRHRLPSEVEWEKAARGPESFVYAYGNTYRRDAANQESGALREVARGAPNGFGLFDMTGNAFEWTSDSYPGAAISGASRQDRVLRGGSFVLDGMYLRASFRMRQRPDVRTDDFGFRVARDATATDLDPR